MTGSPMVLDVLEWLHATLDVVEREASTGCHGGYQAPTWQLDPAPNPRWRKLHAVQQIRNDDDAPELDFIGYLTNGRCEADHVARWSPAVVMAGVAADRAILTETWMSSLHEDCDTPGRSDGCCCTHGLLTGRPCTCGLDAHLDRLTLLIASRYQHRPGYDPAWKPHSSLEERP